MSKESLKISRMIAYIKMASRAGLSAILRNITGKIVSTFPPRPAAPEDNIAWELPSGAGRLAIERGDVKLMKLPPIVAQALVADAEKIIAHKFTFLGLEDEYFGEEINWHRDYKSGYSWPLKHRSELLKDFIKEGSDVKLPWELSRFHHALVLAQAYQYTGDEKYAAELINQVEDWISKNPPYFGVNWLIAMEAAIRAANLMAGFALIYPSPKVTPGFRRSFAVTIYRHGKFIEENLEPMANHYLSDIVGLLFISILFPEIPDSKRWKRLALKELVKEIRHQVYNDGVDYEASTSYHRLALELFFYSAALCRTNGIELPAQYLARLKKMFDFTRHYLKQNLMAPQIGDNDNGRLFIFNNRDVLDHSYLLALADDFFGGDEFRINGPAGLSAASSRPFFDAGIYTMRAPNTFLIVSCGPNGQDGNGGHCHNDKLSFELNVGGDDVIIDPGTYTYTRDPALRNLFRSTAYHNTAVVDGEEQNRFFLGRLFSISEDALTRLLEWKDTPEEVVFSGMHTGYRRLPGHVIQARRIVLNKKNGSVDIMDTFKGSGEHDIKWYFHLAPQASIADVNGPGALLTVRNKDIRLLISTDRVTDVGVEEGWYSGYYGHREKSQVLTYSTGTRLPFVIRFLIRKA